MKSMVTTTMISKDVPPFCMSTTAGRGRVIGLNVIGLRRSGLTPLVRKDIKRAFNLLYRSGLNVSQAVAQIRAEFPEGPARELAEFAATSKRGLCAFAARRPDQSDIDD